MKYIALCRTSIGSNRLFDSETAIAVQAQAHQDDWVMRPGFGVEGAEVGACVSTPKPHAHGTVGVGGVLLVNPGDWGQSEKARDRHSTRTIVHGAISI